ncbi:chromosome segregation protein SMC [Natronosporangium hydrolyticum]|uniref:Chromosome partition protein Smc n=1 Tax=Natronosporangium hydrolyticum TaxID=2811111 RepID=A0A895YDM8_9ACTN|nr:chromosome segregation protein SMC [Natronosporangium hydrolyticum]QSB13553.1 chromosome segregation protein SMC [Natronosporangium hydrolyticum]
MHLKSLTVKGFKSFASPTTLVLEPGITCVVGPNGSGKSNVVDAIAWVLGEHSAKSLRGGKMEDVIFAGTTGRAPLGRAEVTLTIDNGDGALPIDYTEVSITRRMFRSGESEYEINGSQCRLLDIQELLSDSGIGREMHVIVGQGRLDAVLHAKPEERRAFIEEAAGVLKHRKRKEKALRKLDAMATNLNRLTDLTAELRRQLKPLGRQAEVARRAASIQADLRDARLRLLADDLTTLRSNLDRELADEAAAKQRREQVEREHTELNAALADVEAALAADAPAYAAAQDTWFQLSTLQERFRGTGQLAAERLRHLTADDEPEQAGRDPEELIAEAEQVRVEEGELREVLEGETGRLEEAVAAREELERALSAAERQLVAAQKAIADRREGLAKLSGQVEAARSRSTAAADELERLATAVTEAQQRAEVAQTAYDEAAAGATVQDRDTADLDIAHEAAQAEVEAAQQTVTTLNDAERRAEREVTQWQAREEALALGLRRKDGAGALLAAADRVPGLVGSVASLLSVEPGHEVALAVALGGLADAVAVQGVEDAAEAIRVLKIEDAGRVSLLVGGDRLEPPRPEAELPEGGRWARDVVTCPAELRPAVAWALHDIALVPDLAGAADLVSRAPQVRAVTREGDLVGAHAAAGGSAKQPSYLEVQAAVEEAAGNRERAQAQVSQLQEQLTEAREALAAAKEQVRVSAAAKKEAEGQANAAARRLAELGAAASSAQAEVQRLTTAQQRAADAREQGVQQLAELAERLERAEETPVDEEPATEERDQLAAAVPAARQNELEIRLAVRTAEERVNSLAGRADQLLRQAEAQRAARERAAERRAAKQRGAVIAQAVVTGAEAALRMVSDALTVAARQRDEIAAARSAREAELTQLRGQVRQLEQELGRLTDEVHRDQVARAEQRLRIEQLEAKAAEDFGLGVETLVAEYAPDVLVPPTDAAVALAEADGKPVPEPAPYDRASQEKRAAKAERELTLLGKVNPLALEEFAALEERYKFLSDQLEDLKATRKDLLTVVADVDERILDIFTSAYHDTAREFEQVFDVLFPGGEGRLVLTDPDDMLTTGVEVEARPPGKKIKRLSLLSGGERSLTAVAMLVAIFRARPSPFYIMDEVEAALDDVNLGRLIDLMELLKGRSQLIIITHQKRTMEVADALYGTSMRNGVTQVISQRIRSAEPAGSAG